MRKIVIRFAQLAACLAIALTMTVQAADPAGTWTWTTKGRDGTERTSTLKLKSEGGKVTGKISGRQGAETDISDVKVEGDNISFKVVREFNGNTMTQKFNGKIDGDSIKGKIESGREGAEPRDWEAKRKKE